MELLMLALNFFGTKAIIVYVVVILAIVAFGIYSRRGVSSR